MKKRGLGTKKLAESTGLAAPTIRNWREGRVKSPRYWQEILSVAQVLRLTYQEINTLLLPTKHPSLVDLWLQTAEEDRHLFGLWQYELDSALSPSPFQVPPNLDYFIGRQQEVDALQTQLSHTRTIYVLYGMGGVGKTTLATHIAYKMRPYFPDGVLWARVDRSNPMSILDTFAAAYGYDVSRFNDLDSRSRFVCDILGKKQVLLILDNAESSEQIMPLLPPTTGLCAVIITTRHRNLTAVRGRPTIQVGSFGKNGQESLALFHYFLPNQDSSKNQRQTLLKIATLLGHLPLAIAICAGLLMHDLDFPPAALLRLLRQNKIDVVQDKEQSIQTCFDITYHTLSPPQQSFFAALSVFDGNEFTKEAAAYVNELSTDEARKNLHILYNLSFVQTGGQPGRYQLHPLLQSYARQKFTASRPVTRMVEFYMTYVQTWKKDMGAIESEAANIEIALQTASRQNMPLALLAGTQALCRFWKTTGLYNQAQRHLHQAQQTAVGLNDVPRLTKILLQRVRFARRQGQYEQARQWAIEGLAQAQKQNNKMMSCHFLYNLGMIADVRQHFAEGEAYLLEGMNLAAEITFTQGKILLLHGLSKIVCNQGDYPQAEAYLQQALPLAHEHSPDQLSLLCRSLGVLLGNQGKYVEADKFLQKSLILAQEASDQELTSTALMYLGWLAIEKENYSQAQTFSQKSLTLAQKIGHQENMIFSLKNLGIIDLNTNQLEEAENHLNEGLAIARSINHTWLISEILNKQGDLYLKQNQLPLAQGAFAESLQIAQKNLGVKESVAEALLGLAQVNLAQHNQEKAVDLGQESLAIFESIGHFNSQKVRQWLAQVTG